MQCRHGWRRSSSMQWRHKWRRISIQWRRERLLIRKPFIGRIPSIGRIPLVVHRRVHLLLRVVPHVLAVGCVHVVQANTKTPTRTQPRPQPTARPSATPRTHRPANTKTQACHRARFMCFFSFFSLLFFFTLFVFVLFLFHSPFFSLPSHSLEVVPLRVPRTHE